jgi:ubiquinone/menaquinone biosynthesis C-methylase UbiE
MNGARDYHLAELKIASDPNHPDHDLPPPMPPTAKILDVGCGAGQTLVAAYPDRLSFGIDVDFEALQLGRTLSDRTCLVNGAAEALPFRSGQFDLVIARVSLPYTNIPASLREVRRVLGTGGRIWLTLHPFAIPWSQVKRSNYRGKIYFLYVLLNSFWFHLFQRQFSIFGRKYESFQTVRGMKRALAKSGFQDVEVEVARANRLRMTARAQ